MLGSWLALALVASTLIACKGSTSRPTAVADPPADDASVGVPAGLAPVPSAVLERCIASLARDEHTLRGMARIYGEEAPAGLGRRVLSAVVTHLPRSGLAQAELGRALARLGAASEARGVLASARKLAGGSMMADVTLAVVASGHAALGDGASARSAAAEASSPTDRVAALAAASVSARGAGQLELAQTLLASAQGGAVSFAESELKSTWARKAVVAALFVAGRDGEAEALLSEVDPEKRPAYLLATARSLREAGQPARVSPVLARAVAGVSASADANERAKVVVGAVVAARRAGQPAPPAAAHQLEALRTERLYATNRLLVRVASAQLAADAGHIEEATTLLTPPEGKRLFGPLWTLQQAEVLAKAGQLAAAFDAFYRVEDDALYQTGKILALATLHTCVERTPTPLLRRRLKAALGKWCHFGD